MGKVLEKINGFSFRLVFNAGLVLVIGLALLLNLFGWKFGEKVFIVFSFLGLLPVLKNAILALVKKKLTIDLLASIALIFSFIAGEWQSVALLV